MAAYAGITETKAQYVNAARSPGSSRAQQRSQRRDTTANGSYDSRGNFTSSSGVTTPF